MSMQQLVEQQVAVVQDKLSRLGFPKFDIKIDVLNMRSKRCAGKAFTYTNRIEINTKYLNEFLTETLRETVPHEVCHLYVSKYYPRAKQAHGPEFRSIMQGIGCTGKTHHSMALAGGTRNRVVRYVYVSTDGKHLHLTRQQHAKMQRTNNTAYRAKGGAALVYTGKAKVI